MSVEDGAAAADISSEPLSTEIGSGAIENEVTAEAGSEGTGIQGEALDEVAEIIEEAIEDGASDAEIKNLVRSYKLKVNGEEKEVELDFNNEADIIRRLQMAEAGQGAMQKAAELERVFGEEINRLKSDPWTVLEELGFDPDELAESRIERQIQQLQKSPEQVAQEKQTKELEDLRAQLRKEEEARQDADFQKLQQKAEVDLEHEITEALSATTQLPKSPYVMKRVADALMFAMDNGYEDVTAADVIPSVEKDINGELQQFLESMPDKMLEQYIGNKTIDRLRKQRLNKMPKNLNGVRDTGKTPPEEGSAPKKKQSLQDFMKNGMK